MRRLLLLRLIFRLFTAPDLEYWSIIIADRSRILDRALQIPLRKHTIRTINNHKLRGMPLPTRPARGHGVPHACVRKLQLIPQTRQPQRSNNLIIPRLVDPPGGHQRAQIAKVLHQARRVPQDTRVLLDGLAVESVARGALVEQVPELVEDEEEVHPGLAVPRGLHARGGEG